MVKDEKSRARDARTTSAELAELAKSGSGYVRREVAMHQNTDLETLVILSHDEWTPICLLALENHNMKRASSVPILKEMIESNLDFVIMHRHVTRELLDDAYVRAYEIKDTTALETIAQHHRTSPATLASHLESTKAQVRISAVSNPNLPVTSLTSCINDKSFAVRQALAMRKDLPDETARLLADDLSVGVRKAISNNSHLDPYIRSLAETSLVTYRQKLGLARRGRVIDRVTELISSPITSDRYHEDSNHTTPGIRIGANLAAYDQDLIPLEDCLLALSSERWVAIVAYLDLIDPMKSLDIMLAKHISEPLSKVLRADWVTRPDVTRRVLETRVPQFAYDVARYVKLEPWMLELLHGTGRYTLSRIVRNWPKGIAGKAIVDLGRYYAFVPDVLVALHPLTSEEIMVELSKSRLTCVKAALVSKMGPDELRQNARRRIPIRVAVAKNSLTPQDVLLSLSMDRERSVRQAVLTNPKITAEMRVHISLLED